MTPKGPSSISFIVPGVICLGIAMTLAVQLVRPGDQFWTPRELALSADSAADRVEILVDDVPLQEVLESELLVRADDGRPVLGEHVRIRLNDRDRATWVRAVLLSVAGGAGLTLVIVGLMLPRAKPRKPNR